MSDLFSSTAADGTDEVSAPSVPLAARMRPTNLDEVVGQDHITAPGRALHTWVTQLRAGTTGRDGTQAAAPRVTAVGSALLWGPPGTGKTTLARVVAQGVEATFVELSAVTAGVKDIRAAIDTARQQVQVTGRRTVLFTDEIHRFNKAQQDALLPAVEHGWVIWMAATTENPSFSVINALLSRSLVLTLTSLEPQHLRQLIQRAVVHPRGLHGAVSVDPVAVDQIVRLASGDARRALVLLEACAAAALAAPAAPAQPGDDVDAVAPAVAALSGGGAAQIAPVPVISVEVVESIADQAITRYDAHGDQHYDVTSALIKSIRGSDADAALHYLARMISAGEDPRFIARRLVISASEDIGLADPQALAVAVAAHQAVEKIGMPEGRIPLAQATIYLAMAPKSNAAYAAINAALADVAAGGGATVPAHLRDAHYRGAAALGHGVGYQYPHDDPRGVVASQYLPDDLRTASYYHPTNRGWEGAVAERFHKVQAIIRGD